MEWLAIIGLAAWALILHRRVGALSHKLNARTTSAFFDAKPSVTPMFQPPAPLEDEATVDPEPEYLDDPTPAYIAEETVWQPRPAPERITPSATKKARASAFRA